MLAAMRRASQIIRAVIYRGAARLDDAFDPAASRNYSSAMVGRRFCLSCESERM
jgi:hypothetical protein